ncbi:MAG: FkbM family methyltransferase [Nocardiaceae bacterium]|nr:FkbM family methyltransferase [Nocardiaceae bacterium]
MFSDSPVTIRVGGFDIAAPLSHNLPVYVAAVPQYSQNLGDVSEALHGLLGRQISVIDIGANIGDSAAIIRGRSDARVLCIEGDPDFLPYLAENVGVIGAIETAECYVASSDADLASGAVTRLAGTAHIVTGEPQPGGNLAVRGLAEIVESYGSFNAPDLIKIDTDGHDVGIIRGAADFLRIHRPALFFEFDPTLTERAGGRTPVDVFEELGNLGYETALVYSNFGDLVGTFNVTSADLVESAAKLGSTGPVAYWDVLAVAPHHRSLVETLRAGVARRTGNDVDLPA